MMLADMGAEVIKIEQPGVGDPARNLPPFRGENNDRSLAILRANRNKKSLTLDLKKPEGLEVFYKLAATADVLFENLRPDALQKLGVTFEKLREVNPRLIYTSVSGFGHDDVMPGPYADWPAFDIIGQALSGLMFRPENAGEKPVYLGFPLIDIYTSTVAVCGTLQALLHRAITGEGQRVDISLYDTSIVLNELSVTIQSALGKRPSPGLHALTAPFGAFKTPDGYIAIAVLGEKIWQRFCEVIGRRDLLADPDLKGGIDRHRQAARLEAVIEQWLADKTTDEACAILRDAGVPASPVRDVDQLADCPQAKAREMLMEIVDPAWGTIRVPGNPMKLSAAPKPDNRTPPDLGQHTDELLQELVALDAAEIASLRASGTI